MSSYLLGMSPAEIRRLARQHDVWRGHTARAWAAAGFSAGQTIVDLGSGPGFSSLDLAAVVGPSGRVVAIDASETACRHLRDEAERRAIRHLEIVTADVEGVDLSAWRPDGVFARWLFSFLPDPGRILERVAGALAPGATLALMDYWNYRAIHTEPASALFARIFRAVYDSFAEAGGSLDVAGGFPALCQAHGVRITDVSPCVEIGRPGSAVWQWIGEFQDLYLPRLVDNGALSEADLRTYGAWWAEQSTNPGALLFTPPMLSVIGVKT